MNERINQQLLEDIDQEIDKQLSAGIPMFDVVINEPKQVDLFGYAVPEVQAPIVFSDAPAIVGQDILTIRTLTGKKRDNAMQALYAATVAMFDAASPDCFYIPTNTASSKNSKEIGFYLKKNPITGRNERVNILTDSKVTKAYKKATAGHWLKGKVEFLNQTRHLPLPIQVEFTFIRDSLRRFDVHNAIQVLADLMVDNGWIPDDESVYFIPVFNKVTYFHNRLAGVLLRVIK